jgi:hypothetical protein
MRFKLAYGLLAGLLAAAVGVGSYVVASGEHTKTVVKTVTRSASFRGTPQSLAEFLHAPQAQQVSCPAGIPAGSVCVQFVGQTWVVYAAFAGPQQAG